MGTKGDFYIGSGLGIEWIGSTGWDAYPTGLPQKLKTATTEQEFKTIVQEWLCHRKDSYLPKEGWPWPWFSSYKTNYSYCFMGDKLYACAFGSSWWLAQEDEPDHTTLIRRGAQLPDMSSLPRNPKGLFIQPRKK